jgi:hypothetical protein
VNESVREKTGLEKDGLVLSAIMSGGIAFLEGSLIVASIVPSRYRSLRQLFRPELMLVSSPLAGYGVCIKNNNEIWVELLSFQYLPNHPTKFCRTNSKPKHICTLLPMSFDCQ